MGLDKVKQEILEKAQKEQDGIISTASSEAKAIMGAAEKTASEGEARLKEEFESSYDGAKKREVASAQLELQKQALAIKSELINLVFEQVKKKLLSLNDKKRESHVKILLERAKKELDVSTVFCNPRDARFFDGSSLKVTKTESISGGIIAESPDGKFRADYSYESLLEQVKSRVLSDVARALFGK